MFLYSSLLLHAIHCSGLQLSQGRGKFPDGTVSVVAATVVVVDNVVSGDTVVDVDDFRDVGLLAVVVGTVVDLIALVVVLDVAVVGVVMVVVLEVVDVVVLVTVVMLLIAS